MTKNRPKRVVYGFVFLSFHFLTNTCFRFSCGRVNQSVDNATLPPSLTFDIFQLSTIKVPVSSKYLPFFRLTQKAYLHLRNLVIPPASARSSAHPGTTS